MPPKTYRKEMYPAARVVSMRQWLIGKRDFDRLRQIRPWGIGNVVQHKIAIGESRERPGQMRIERGWEDD